ncbi:Protein QNR-71 [Merluccius polli]|uniref:Protein QNR-71 n=1 Tax=Merluccius polli TaxID=89951 RepID=A0AA47NWU5_MERPO|nr:Protein QNR-71 [Merluccius polli]
MGASLHFPLLALAYLLHQADGKTYADMFPHKHALPIPGKFPFPIPPIPGWDPDTNPWNDYLYPPFGPKPKDLARHRSKPVKVRLTSDSPAINGSSLSFTAKLEYPPCQKEDDNGDLVLDKGCDDGMELEASANGQKGSGPAYNWTSWLDDYGFGKCTDLKTCNVFPDGKPFPQSNDWRRKGYVYVWHSMGQYHETCDGSSSSLTLNTSDFVLGTEVMEVMVYRKRERRKYVPLATDNTIYFITDKIPLAVNISQKAAANLSANVFYRDQEVLFDVKLHDPSGYLKTASSVDYMWDFSDGNHLVTHNNMATHAYSADGKVRVNLMVKAAFEIPCPPPASGSPPPPTEAPETPATTSKMDTTQAVRSTAATPVTSSAPTGFPTEPFASTEADATPRPNPTALLHARRQADGGKCFRYIYGYFGGNITIIAPPQGANGLFSSQILAVSTTKETDTDISFLIKCFGSIPTMACTVVSDITCTAVIGIVCNDVQPAPGCVVRLRRRFPLPGTYCVNITLGNHGSSALATTSVTVSRAQEAPVSTRSPHTTKVVLTASALLAVGFAFIAFMVYKRYKLYRPVNRVAAAEDGAGRGTAGSRIGRLRETLFPTDEESRHLLTDRRPL